MVQLVSELFQNSLDAGATHVDVGLNIDEWTCWVADNGSGITKEDLSRMALSCGEEGRYGTSKAYSLESLGYVETFGFRGEALTSIADLCCLEISSRTRNSTETWCIITKGDKTIYRGPAMRWRRESPGTVVYVRDAFYNLPIRRMSHPSSTRSLEMLRQELEAFALGFPNISFSVRNEKDKQENYVMKYPKTASPLAAFRHIYGRALVEHVEELKTASGNVILEGFLSLSGVYSKNYQYIFVNRHCIAPCELHQVVNQKFENSTFAKHALDEHEDTSRSSARRSPRKSIKKPVYVLQLSVPSQQVDNCLEPAKTSVQLKDREAVIALLTDTVGSFLARNGFISTAKKVERSRSDSSVALPQKRRKIERDHSQEATPLFAQPDFDDSNTPICWVDAKIGVTYNVDRRSGNSSAQCSAQRRSLPLARTQSVDRPVWLDKALKENTAFHQKEASIPTVKSKLEDGLRRIEKMDLRAAQVVGQVDGKFIACVLPGGSLVLVDQHVADERVRVERLIKEMETGGANELDPPKPILLTTHEARQLASDDVQSAFLRWGIGFEDSKGGERSSTGYEQIFVNRVPAVVEEKILVDSELRDVVRGYLAKMAADGTFGRNCPDELLELVKSKACRGAVMFNDILTHEQCERLLSQLAETQFPFQCAHGRPSLVPIADFGTEEEKSERGGVRIDTLVINDGH